MTKTRKLLSIVLTLCLVAALMPMMATTAQAAGDGSAPTTTTDEWDNGGTIDTAADLAQLAYNVNNGKDYSEQTITLTTDIALNEGALSDSSNEWTPIGTESDHFKGTFDGGGYEISGLYINVGGNYQGLFGVVGETGTVQNLKISGSVSAVSYVGGVAGNNYGTIINCTNSATIKAKAAYNIAGGVAGYSSGAVINSTNSATVSAEGNNARVGGLVGLSEGTVTNSYNIGEVSGGSNAKVGGLVGWNNTGSTVTNSYWTTDKSTSVGVGDNDDTVQNIGSFENTSSAITLTDNSTNTEDIPETNLLAALNAGTEAYNTENPDAILAEYWMIKEGENDGYPVFATYWSDFADGSGVADWNATNITIRTAEQLAYLAKLVNIGEGKTEDEIIGNDFDDQTITLADDIDLSGHMWVPIGESIDDSMAKSDAFWGTFDGGGHKIEGLYIYAPDANYQGLFGYATGGTIKNLGVDGSITGGYSVGGIAGRAISNIENCYNAATVTGKSAGGDDSRTGGVAGYSSGWIESSYNTGTITGIDSVGGVAGYADEEITNCYNTGEVTGIADVGGVVGRRDSTKEDNYPFANCYNIGEVTGQIRVGGLVGRSLHSISNCYNVGTVTGSVSEDGSVTFGGIVGITYGPVKNCYWLERTAGQGVGAGITWSFSTENIIPFTSATGKITWEDGAVHANLLEALNVGTTVYHNSDVDFKNDGIQLPSVPADYWKANGAYPTFGIKGILSQDITLPIATYGQPLPMAEIDAVAYGKVLRTTYVHNGVELNADSDAGIYTDTVVTIETATHRGVKVVDYEIGKATYGDVFLYSMTTSDSECIEVDLSGIAAALGEGVVFETPSDGSIANSILTYNVADVAPPITVEVISKNYEDFTVTINVITLVVEGLLLPTLTAQNITVPYDGEAVTIDDFQKTADPADGIWEIVSPTGDALKNANNGIPVTLQYQPSMDDKDYFFNYITVMLTINKAVPEGAPTFSEVAAVGSKLNDVIVTTSGISQAGTFMWSDSIDTAITANTAYSWIFIPDNSNYEVLTGKHVFFRTPSSGGGGSSKSDDTISHGDSIDSDDLQDLIDDEETLKVEGENDLEVEFDEKALGAILGEADGKDIEFIAKEADEADLNEDQKITIGNNLVLDLQVLVDGVEFTDFETGEVTVSLPYELEEGENAENLKVYYVDDDGNKMLIESSYENGILTFKTNHFSLYMVTYEIMNFEDVLDTDWFYESVMYAYENGLMNGISDTEFDPNGSTIRAMMWTVLARMDGVETSGGEQWYSVAQNWAIENEISDGTDPDGLITREQFVTMLYRYEGSPLVTADMVLDKYSDYADISDWAMLPVDWAVKAGIISGETESVLDPQGSATRAEIATMLMRYMENSN